MLPEHSSIPSTRTAYTRRVTDRGATRYLNTTRVFVYFYSNSFGLKEDGKKRGKKTFVFQHTRGNAAIISCMVARDGVCVDWRRADRNPNICT